jgi:FtsZ-binding cell division protein ZapB
VVGDFDWKGILTIFLTFFGGVVTALFGYLAARPKNKAEAQRVEADADVQTAKSIHEGFQFVVRELREENLRLQNSVARLEERSVTLERRSLQFQRQLMKLETHIGRLEDLVKSLGGTAPQRPEVSNDET